MDDFEKELKSAEDAFATIAIGVNRLLEVLKKMESEHKDSALVRLVVELLNKNTFNPLIVKATLELTNELIQDTDRYYNIKNSKDLLEHLRRRYPDFAQGIPPQNHNHF